MKITENPDVVQWPESHYVFIERVGPFKENAEPAWRSAHKLFPDLQKNNRVTKYMSLYKRGPQIYRAGFVTESEPKNLPEGFSHEKLPGGKYSRFVVTGGFSEMPAASGRVFEIVAEKRIEMREDYCIENYVTDPAITPVDRNVIEILIPTA